MTDPEFAETTTSRFTKGLVRELAERTQIGARLLARAGLSDAPLSAPLDDDTARRVWIAATELTGDVDLGLRFAEAAALQDLGIIGYIARASATVGDACSRVVELEQLCKEYAQLRIEYGPRGVTIIDVPPPGKPAWPRQLAEAIMASWVLWPRRWAGAACRCLRVCFQHPQPAELTRHQHVFDCEFEFGAPINAIMFSTEVWSLPLTTADGLLAHYLETAASQQLEQIVRDPFIERLEDVLVDLLPSGEVGVPRVARALGLSSRTLHRRLSEHGITYRDLLDELRRRTALTLLERRQHTVSEVAFMVGFSDPSGLRRAVRRWSQSEAAHE